MAFGFVGFVKKSQRGSKEELGLFVYTAIIENILSMSTELTKPDNKHLPLRLREESFRKYEHIWQAAVEAYPRCITLDPTKIKGSVLTFTARLRDAKESLHLYHWPTAVNMERFEELYDDLVVSHKDNTVKVGNRFAMKETYGFMPELPDDQPPTAVDQPTIHLDSLPEKTLICRLAALGMFTCPVRVSGLSTEEAKWFQDNYDVRIDLDKGDYIIT